MVARFPGVSSAVDEIPFFLVPVDNLVGRLEIHISKSTIDDGCVHLGCGIANLDV
jgi:hypothetical protein